MPLPASGSGSSVPILGAKDAHLLATSRWSSAEPTNTGRIRVGRSARRYPTAFAGAGPRSRTRSTNAVEASGSGDAYSSRSRALIRS